MSSVKHSELPSLTGRRWLWLNEGFRPAKLVSSDSRPVLETILHGRGILEPAAIQRFLSPSLSALTDPLLMIDMDTAVERIIFALTHTEHITIFGDYDADGVCATSILVEFLRRMGGHVDYYIPDRRTEGYGLNIGAIKSIAKSTRLLIAVDCGITALAELALAKELGMDAVVLDHHRVLEKLPTALACVNPQRPDCPSAGAPLCAAGLAFMLVTALRRALREAGRYKLLPEPDVRDFLDLVAIATVADMVPLRDINRTLVSAGLRQIGRSSRVGLLALLEISGVKPEAISAIDLGFRIGPRINARGRIGHAGEAVELLLTESPERARLLAGLMDAANRSRRELESQILQQAKEQIGDQDLSQAPTLVLYDPLWHPGVLGLVATRLVGCYHRPAIVIGEGGKGSGRSVEGFNLHTALESLSSYFLRFGGHAAAAGVTIAPENISRFRQALNTEVQNQLGLPPYSEALYPELEVQPAQVTFATLAALLRLAPFGQANPEPLLVMRNLTIQAKRLVGQKHLKLKLAEGTWDVIGFDLGYLLDKLPSKIDIVFTLDKNEYAGNTNLQLRLNDVRLAG